MSHQRAMSSIALVSCVVPAGVCTSLVNVTVLVHCLQKCVNLSKGNADTA